MFSRYNLLKRFKAKHVTYSYDKGNVWFQSKGGLFLTSVLD